MSDVIEATPAAAEPISSTADVASQVIDSYEPDTPAETTETPAVLDTPAPEPELSPAAKFLLEQGHREHNGRGGKTYLPYATVQKMLDRYAENAQKAWEAEKVTPLASERDSYKTQIERLRQQALGPDTDAFIREVAQFNPAFARYLERQQEQQQAQAQSPIPANDPMPEPDVHFQDGSRSYSVEGLNKRDEWLKRQWLRDVDAKLDERFKPIAEREKAEKEQQQQIAAVRGQLETAKSWQNWTDYEPDVLKKLQEDSATAQREGRRPSMTLREAYLEVRAERLTTERNTVRGEVINELKTAPKGTSVPRVGGEVPKQQGPRSTSDVAARTLERLERQGA